MGELHLDIIIDRMRREFKVEATVGAPQVSYREAFTKQTSAQGKFVRQSGGKGQYGDVWVEFTSMKRVKDSNSKMPLLVVLFLVNTSQPLNKV